MKKFLILVSIILYQFVSYGQEISELYTDTLHLTLNEAETMFLKNNLDLLAQKFSIDSAKATVITARLYDNPGIDFSNAFYNPTTHTFFDSERSVQVSQLIKLAGKRSKSIDMARSGIEVAQYQFYDLLRTLRFILRNDFSDIYYRQQSAKVYQVEITPLQKIVTASRELASKGYIAQAELLRIQSQLYTLQAEYDNLQTGINQVQGEIKSMILANPASYLIVAPVSDLNKEVVTGSSYQSLIDSALVHRPDLKALQSTIAQSNLNLSLQKAMAVPDIVVSAGYDHLGGYIKNFNEIGISVPLPFFNRNQGNIKNAKIQVDVNKTLYESEIVKVKNDVTTNYITAIRSEKLLRSFDPEFENVMQKLIEQVTYNYEKKNISILEFLDRYDSYKQNVLQMNQLRFNKISSIEQLNFSIGKIIFNQ